MTPGIPLAAGWGIVTAVAGGLLTTIGPWYRNLRKPSWQPPDWAFAPAWTLIFVSSGTAGVIAWNGAGALMRGCLIAAFVTNGVLNMTWSFLFFNRRRPDLALIEVGPLWLSILAMLLAVGTLSRHAALLVLPYLLWVSFAAYLNLTIVRLNPRPRSS